MTTVGRTQERDRARERRAVLTTEGRTRERNRGRERRAAITTVAANTCDTVNSSDTDTIETDAEAAERAHLHFLSQLRDMDESDILPEPIDPQHVDRLVAEACELKGRKPLSCSVCAEWQPARTARSLFIKPLSELPAAFWEILKPPSGNNALDPLAIQQYNLLNASLYDQVPYAE